MTRSGNANVVSQTTVITVLIPLLVDDPLWGHITKYGAVYKEEVLIPLLVDDPLWVN